MRKTIILIIALLTTLNLFPQPTIEIESLDQLNEHKTIRDANGALLSWYLPDIPGAGYDHVVKLASEFMINIPNDPKSGLKMYYVLCCFQGPHMHDFPEKDAPEGIAPSDWMHNPACVFSGSVHSFARKYYQYTGEKKYIEMVRKMLDYQLEHGTTPAGWIWEKVPYASSDPHESEYEGATRWEHDGMRGDGLHGIEPDKIGEMGYAYVKFYEISSDKKYLDAALNCADALAKNIYEVKDNGNNFLPTDTEKSPWPFRVNARTGNIISEYCSNITEPIKLFDEVLRIKGNIQLEKEKEEAYQKARDMAWDWLYSRSGPMKTYIWAQYFEDIPNDPERSNRNQVTPMEWAKYLIENPKLDSRYEIHVPALIHWVLNTFGDETISAIKEQTWCYEPMGSHSARYGSTCAMWYEHTGDEWYKEQAFRNLNYATYMTYKNGVVAVGHTWPGSWFSDGYSDYVRHFFDAMAAIPEWAPADEDHLLKSTSVIKNITYSDKAIQYETYENESKETLRLVSKPTSVKVNGKELDADKWKWKELEKGGVLTIDHTTGNKITISK